MGARKSVVLPLRVLSILRLEGRTRVIATIIGVAHVGTASCRALVGALWISEDRRGSRRLVLGRQNTFVGLRRQAEHLVLAECLGELADERAVGV